VKDAAAEAANVSDPARESPLIERIHPSSRSPDVFRGASEGGRGGTKNQA
jgi:hypothetical protein